MKDPSLGAAIPCSPGSGVGRRRLRRAAFLAAGFLLAAVGSGGGFLAGIGARRRSAEGRDAVRRPLPAGARLRFAYPEAGLPARPVLRWKERAGWGYTSCWLKLPVTTPGHPPHVAQVVSYRSSVPGRRPAVLVSPILGGDYALAGFAAAALARRGYHAAVVLRSQSALPEDEPPAALADVWRTAVIDRRRALDWLCARDDVDSERIGALGASLGGVSTVALAAVDSRVRALAVLFAGGDLPSVLLASEEPRVRRYVRAQKARGLTPSELTAALRRSLAPGILHLAESLDPACVLFVAARRDRVVPYRTQERLWESLGRPERIDLPTGHYGAVLYAPYLLDAVAEFFARRLNPR